MSAITDSGTSEATKAAVHGALLTLAALCGVYNGCAWLKRRERHLATNLLLYASLVAFEAYQVTHHFASDARQHHVGR